MNVSIIIPVYNAQEYLERCIESILNQTLDLEIILIDDGSTDESWKVIEKYTKLYNCIKGIKQKNGGPSKARNKGIQEAKGKYIGFVDADDYIEPIMYDELYKIANTEKVEIAMCNYKEIHLWNEESYNSASGLEANRVYKKEDISKDIISTFSKNENYGFYSVWNKIYLKDFLIKENIKFDESRDHGEDWWFNISLFTKLSRFICTDKVLYNYIHSNENSLAGKYRVNQFDLYTDGRKKIISIVPKEYIDFKELDERLIYEATTQILRTFKNIKEEKKRKEIIYKILKDEEFKEICKKKLDMRFQYKLVFFLENNSLYRCLYYFYKLVDLCKSSRG